MGFGFWGSGERKRLTKTGNRQSMDGAINGNICFGSTHALPLPWLVAPPFLPPHFFSFSQFRAYTSFKNPVKGIVSIDVWNFLRMIFLCLTLKFSFA